MSASGGNQLSKHRMLAMRRGIADARAVAQGDAESFAQLVVAIEDLGAALYGEYTSLGVYENAFITNLALGHEQQEFQRLFRMVRWGRNTAVHSGAWARHATASAVELALLIEDALARNIMAADQNGWRVEYFMVRDPFCAQLWQGISDLRRCMLRNSFSYLPVQPEPDLGTYDPGRWYLLSDHALARWLGEPESQSRRQNGQMTLAAALKAGLKLEGPVTQLSPHSSRTEALDATARLPALVSSRSDDPERIMGIVTAFDLL